MLLIAKLLLLVTINNQTKLMDVRPCVHNAQKLGRSLKLCVVRLVERPKHGWRDEIVGQQGAVWPRIAKDRESCRTLVESYFLQWKDSLE